MAGHYRGGLAWSVSVLFGSILVVTGPTVIMPLLRQAKLEPRASALLKREGIINDSIGATLGLLMLDFLVALRGHSDHVRTISVLAGRAAFGALVTGLLGFALPSVVRFAFRRDLAPQYLKTPSCWPARSAIMRSERRSRPRPAWSAPPPLAWCWPTSK